MVCRILSNGPELHVHSEGLSVADLKRFTEMGWSVYTTGCYFPERPVQMEQGSSSKAQGYSRTI
jgi:hypothetical protein